MKELLAATSNPHKLHELRAIFAPLGWRVLSLDDVRGPGMPAFPEPAEDGDTFEANATKKALAYARMTGRACLADDSGLEVDALGGAPGVHSAYYAGVGATRAERDAANNARLLRELESMPDEKRSARFVCVMALAKPNERSPHGAHLMHLARGEFPGAIGRAPRGTNGFGYDPLLITSDGRTSAELSDEDKNARSHRGAAARAMAAWLRANERVLA